MSDPSQLPGLAHFCEHMLFLGTEKVTTSAHSLLQSFRVEINFLSFYFQYPSENEFTQVNK